jgi:hypothetical protein
VHVFTYTLLVSLQVSNVATLSIGYMFFFFLFVACYLGLITLIYHSSQTPCLYFHRFLMLQLFLFITWFLPFVLCYLGLIALICHSRGELVTVRYMV